jgi:site-specific DNA recombinase
MTGKVAACGIYARISQDDGTALGVARQINDCTAEAQRRGWPVREVFTDNDVSATRSKARPEYERLLSRIELGAIDAVVVFDIDRLTRTPSELEHFIDLADRHGIALASIGGEIDLATPQGRLTARIKGSVARHEVEQMSRRLKRKFQQSAAEGKSHGVVPFGYRRERLFDERGRDIGARDVVVPDEAEAVRELYRQLLTGESLRNMAKFLNDKGFVTGRGNAFQGNVVGNMLRKPRYAGHRTHGKEIVSKGDWEPLISQETYDRALAVLGAPGRRHSRGLEAKYLLSGIGRCGRCEGVLRPNVGTRRPPSYVCPKCMRLTRQTGPVDEVVEAMMVGRLSVPGLEARMSGDPTAAAAAAESRDTILARLDDAADKFADGAIDARTLARINARLRPQLIGAEADVLRSQPQGILDGMTGAAAANAWAGATIHRRREIVKALAKVTVLPSGPGIRFSPEQVRFEWIEEV